jgi:hypothetical protein
MKTKVVCQTSPDHAKISEKSEPLLAQGSGIVNQPVGEKQGVAKTTQPERETSRPAVGPNWPSGI